MRKRPLLALTLLCLGSALAHAQSALDVSLLSTTALETKLAERRAELAQERADKLALEQQLASLPALEHSLEATLTRDVRALYRLRRGGLLPMADGLESLMSHASRVAHFERMTRRTLQRLSESRRSGALLAGEVTALEVKIGECEQALIELEHAQAALAREAAATQAFEDSRVASVAPSPDALSSTGGGSGYGLSIVGGSSPGPKLRGFLTQRGELALPVSGAASIQDAQTLQGEPRALTFVTKPGGSVRAAADGRVVLAEPREGHGILVIVEHGDRFRTLYGGLEAADVQPGDAISKSARIGTAGSQPIYFEVRHAMRSQDARGWLGL
ncbi:MAG: Periplasmic septal ring factor with murein hydrolase EnvC/YibP [Myxococcaceae bacterium]|nr:Periplasmic septal ring factor with murein hydrolase EnvC/YibP [Myxococcaceae bacterium]